MFKKNVQIEKSKRILQLTEHCYDNLETAQVLAKLLQENFCDNKNAAVTLDVILSNIKSTVNYILEIQDSI